jgi:hypothetical protein
LLDTNKKVGLCRFPRHDQKPADELIAIEHEAEAALVRFAAGVASGAVCVQDGFRLLSERRRVRKARPRRQHQAGPEQEPSEFLHDVLAKCGRTGSRRNATYLRRSVHEDGFSRWKTNHDCRTRWWPPV